MKGSVVKRHKGSYSLVVDLGRVPDPTTGLLKRKQQWVTFTPAPGTTAREARKQADAKLAELLGQVDKGTYIEASKTTLIQYLRDWAEQTVKPTKRPETHRVYASFIEKHVASARIANLSLQKLRKSDLEAFYNVDLAKLAPSSVTVCHAVISKALNDAVEDGLLSFNVAERAKNRRKPDKDAPIAHAQHHCWSATEARDFLAAAAKTGVQASAFYALALDCGGRKSELLALGWDAVDLDKGTVTISRQLDAAGPSPVFGPLKTKRRRVVGLNAETIGKLKVHKAAQATLKMRNRTAYRDCGLVFAREPEHLQTPAAKLGEPCLSLTAATFRQVCKAAEVRRIKFHGLRHTCATLSLAANVPVHVVAKRLGHASAVMTLDVYGHVLPNMQQDAAAKLGALLANG